MTESAASVAAELDPRIGWSRRVVPDAVIAAMAAVGYGAMTIEAVAKRSGVSTATFYRQWKSKLEIVESALGAMTDSIVIDDWRPPKERLTNLLIDMLVGPLFHRRLVTAEPFPLDDVRDLVATILG